MGTARNRRRTQGAHQRPRQSMRQVYEATRGAAPMRTGKKTAKSSFRWLIGLSVLCTLLFIGMVAGARFIQGTPKIGYVNASFLVEDMGYLESAKKELYASIEQWNLETEELYAHLGIAQERLDVKKNWVSWNTRQRLEKDVADKRKILEDHLQKVEHNTMDKEFELRQALVKKLNTFVQNWGQKHGYDVIYTVASGNEVLQNLPKLDVTEKIQLAARGNM